MTSKFLDHVYFSLKRVNNLSIVYIEIKESKSFSLYYTKKMYNFSMM